MCQPLQMEFRMLTDEQLLARANQIASEMLSGVKPETHTEKQLLEALKYIKEMSQRATERAIKAEKDFSLKYSHNNW